MAFFTEWSFPRKSPYIPPPPSVTTYGDPLSIIVTCHEHGFGISEIGINRAISVAAKRWAPLRGRTRTRFE